MPDDPLKFDPTKFTLPETTEPPVFSDPVFASRVKPQTFTFTGKLIKGGVDPECRARVLRTGQHEFHLCGQPTVICMDTPGGYVPICQACADNIYGDQWRHAHASAIRIETVGWFRQFAPDGQTESWEV